MARVRFTTLLKRFYPELHNTEAQGNNVAEVLAFLDEQHPGLKDYLVDERGKLREHVNIFIGEDHILDTQTLQDKVQAQDEIFIAQAVSGG